MPGVLVFHRLLDALREGFAVCGNYERGYIVRRRTSTAWEMALVELKPC